MKQEQQEEEGRETYREGSMNCPAIIRGPFKIVSLDIGTNDVLSGWLSDAGGRYGKFWVNWFHSTGLRFDRMQYRDLDHFAGVLGKFDIYAFCLAEPIEVPELSYLVLLEIKHKFPQYKP